MTSLNGIGWLGAVTLLLLVTCLQLCQGASIWQQQLPQQQQPSDEGRERKLQLLKEMLTELREILFSLDEDSQDNQLPLDSADDFTFYKSPAWSADSAKRDIPDGFAAMRGKRKMEFGSPIVPTGLKVRGSPFGNRPSSFVSVRGKRTVSMDGFNSESQMSDHRSSLLERMDADSEKPLN